MSSVELPSLQIKNYSILFIINEDDAAYVAETVSKILDKNSYTITCNKEDAFNAVKKEAYHFIIMDIDKYTDITAEQLSEMSKGDSSPNFIGFAHEIEIHEAMKNIGDVDKDKKVIIKDNLLSKDIINVIKFVHARNLLQSIQSEITTAKEQINARKC